jgi:hypothetical protein
MTRQFNGYGTPTEFSNWLREQPELDSHQGYRATNLDYIWVKAHYSDIKEFMLIEEKRLGGLLSKTQRSIFGLIHRMLSLANNPAYKGFYIVKFSKRSPDDGSIYVGKFQEVVGDGSFKIKGTEMTRDEFVEFLRFNHWLIEEK